MASHLAAQPTHLSPDAPSLRAPKPDGHDVPLAPASIINNEYFKVGHTEAWVAVVHDI